MAAVLVFAGKSVATAAISFLINKALDYLDKYRKSEGMEEVQSRLRRAMPQIQSVFDVVQPQRVREQQSSALDEWLWQLRDAVEEAEDSIDELEYHELEAKTEDQKVSGRGCSCLGKMKNKFFRSAKNASPLNKTLKRLVKAVEGLDKAAAGVANFLVLTEHLRGTASSSQQLVDSDRQTGSALSATIFVGRQKEKEQLIQWLTNTSAESAATASMGRLPIVSLVGHGGMGKTTLAQSVCETSEVRKRFKVVWATVSTAFDATSVTSRILECVTGKKPTANHLEPLQKQIQRIMNSFTFLLVLDDVWEDKKRDEWEKLFAPFRKLNTSRSKILLTTRMRSVASMAAEAMQVKEEQCLTLGGLKEDENLELFNHHAYYGLDPHEYDHFELIGEEIARKLGGCPLVTKVASGHLHDIMTLEYWNNFRDKGLEHFKGTEEDIMKILRLSYYHLPVELQLCFRFCSLFPEDHEFFKEELVKMWVGSGLISQATSYSQPLKVMDTGEQFLAQLTKKSFFDVKTKELNGVVGQEYYVMHDILHELAINVSFGECARINDPTRLHEKRDTVRHLCVSHINRFSVEDVKRISYFKNLRSIIIDSYDEVDEDTVCAIEEIVESSKSLRLFHSSLRNTFHIADKFGELKHLRYLYLDRISPEGIRTVSKLYHLTLIHYQNGLERAT